MPGGEGVFPTLTVAENLRLAVLAEPQGHGRGARRPRSVLDAVPAPRATGIDQMAGDLSGGEQQMLALGQALIPDPSCC